MKSRKGDDISTFFLKILRGIDNGEIQSTILEGLIKDIMQIFNREV
jgi:hypothetical protein